MASAPHLTFPPFLSLSTNPSRRTQNLISFSGRRNQLKIRAAGTDLLGDFGARDPFPEEIESNFCEKVLGNMNTEHKIMIPNSSALSLSRMECSPVSELQPLSEEEIKQLLFKVVGWRIVNEGESVKLEGVWKLRDIKCAEELIDRIRKTVESTGHFPTLHLKEPNQVRAQLWTSSIGGLSINDFIVAAKIDEIKTSDLRPRLRVWA